MPLAGRHCGFDWELGSRSHFQGRRPSAVGADERVLGQHALVAHAFDFEELAIDLGAQIAQLGEIRYRLATYTSFGLLMVVSVRRARGYDLPGADLHAVARAGACRRPPDRRRSAAPGAVPCSDRRTLARHPARVDATPRGVRRRLRRRRQRVIPSEAAPQTGPALHSTV